MMRGVMVASEKCIAIGTSTATQSPLKAGIYRALLVFESVSKLSTATLVYVGKLKL